MNLRIIPSTKINKQKWDACIKSSSNALVYATGLYLHCLAENWDGIIADDYRFVMPVPWKKKFGIRYCCTVSFIQQLGIFGDYSLQEAEKAIEFLKKNFMYGDYAFNFLNNFSNTSQHNNYVLDLSKNYDELKLNYRSHQLKNLNNAKKFSLQYAKANVDETISMFRQLYAKRLKDITSSHFERLIKFCKQKETEGNIITRKIYSNNSIAASGLLIKDENRLYNIITSATPEGRKQSAGSFLFNAIIKEFAGSNLLLDLEGSDIEGIAFFYKGFGAVNQSYFRMHINNLPLPLRIFKQ